MIPCRQSPWTTASSRSFGYSSGMPSQNCPPSRVGPTSTDYWVCLFVQKVVVSVPLMKVDTYMDIIAWPVIHPTCPTQSKYNTSPLSVVHFVWMSTVGWHCLTFSCFCMFLCLQWVRLRCVRNNVHGHHGAEGRYFVLCAGRYVHTSRQMSCRPVAWHN